MHCVMIMAFRDSTKYVCILKVRLEVHTLADWGFLKDFLYQGGVKSTVSWVFEDIKFKISEGYDQKVR